MTHLRAHRNGVLCLVAVMAMAGCATRLNSNSSDTHAVAPAAVATTAAPASSPPTAPVSSAIDQQVSTIDNQLSTVNGQLNAANAGLNSSEGDPTK